MPPPPPPPAARRPLSAAQPTASAFHSLQQSHTAAPPRARRARRAARAMVVARGRGPWMSNVAAITVQSHSSVTMNPGSRSSGQPGRRHHLRRHYSPGHLQHVRPMCAESVSAALFAPQSVDGTVRGLVDISPPPPGSWRGRPIKPAGISCTASQSRNTISRPRSAGGSSSGREGRANNQRN